MFTILNITPEQPESGRLHFLRDFRDIVAINTQWYWFKYTKSMYVLAQKVLRATGITGRSIICLQCRPGINQVYSLALLNRTSMRPDYFEGGPTRAANSCLACMSSSVGLRTIFAHWHWWLWDGWTYIPMRGTFGKFLHQIQVIIPLMHPYVLVSLDVTHVPIEMIKRWYVRRCLGRCLYI